MAESEKRELWQTIPAVGTGAGIAWTIIDGIRRVDFVLSIGYRPLAEILQATLSGLVPWLFISACIIWWIVAVMKQAAKPPLALLAVVVAVPAFAIGAILTASFGNPPRLLTAYQQVRSLTIGNATCSGGFATSRLTQYAEDYRLHLVCGVTDSDIDRRTDERIQFSGPFTITGSGVAISTPITEEDKHNWFMTHGRWWFVGVLIPEGLDMDRIVTLEDVERNDGIILPDLGLSGRNVRYESPRVF